jgi:hypothetical protein
MDVHRKYSALRYAQEKLVPSVYSFATSTESLQCRLASAYLFNLMHAISEGHKQGESSLPSEIREGFTRIENAMDAITIRDDRGLEASIESQMPEEEARTLIKLIVDLNYEAESEQFD